MSDTASPYRSYHERDAHEEQVKLSRLMELDGRGRILIRGAAVVTMDEAVPDLARGDVLIDGNRIEAVGPDLLAQAGGAVTFDALGMIVIPGMIDGHRHCWQNQLRHLICDAEIDEYIAMTHGSSALHYRPEDMYAGNMVTMLGALDSGVTTVLDFSHNSRSSAHSDAVFSSYLETGIRVVHTSAPPNTGAWGEQFPKDLVRLRDTYSAGTDGLRTVRMGIDMRRVDTAENLLAFARSHGFAITFDGVMGPPSSDEVEQLGAAGLLGPDVTFVHCTDMSETAWLMMADAGAKVTLAPTSDEQLGLADGVPPVQQALDHGVRPSLSVDVEISLSNDMFTQMRCVLVTQRMLATQRAYRGEIDVPDFITNRDVFDFATVRGAEAVGLSDRVGSITPGKEADLVLVRAEDVNNLPLNSAIGTIVQGTDTRNIDTVLVAGKVRKWQGDLVGQDLSRLRSLAVESRDYLAEKVGFVVDPMRRQGLQEIQDPFLKEYFAARHHE